MAKVYYDADVNLTLLKGKTVAVIGFGSQGHAHALNLRTVAQVVVGAVPGGRGWTAAEKAGAKVTTTAEAAEAGDVIMILTPDELQPSIYEEQIRPHLKPGNALAFAHGFNIHFGQIVPPNDVDVIMIAPKGPGHLVRRQYQEGSAVPALIAVYQTRRLGQQTRRHAKDRLHASVLETTFKEETETDLSGEQAVPAVVFRPWLMGDAVEATIAYFECLHELKLIVDLIHEAGIAMRY